MPHRPSVAFVLPAVLALSACVTERMQPKPSAAVLEARAHRGAQRQANACLELTSPASVGFAFGEPGLSELAAPALGDIAASLACHPSQSAVIVGQADAHGTDAEQKKLAADRAQAVADDLTKRGVAASRLTTQAGGAAPAGDAQHLVILAEGRRW